MNVNAGVWMAMSPESRYKSLEIAQRITKERWKTKNDPRQRVKAL